ncbi:hypothetical protein MXB_4654, partial [Myxobolus squamalis]
NSYMLAITIFFLITLNSFYQLSIDKKSFEKEWLEYKLKYKLKFPESEEKRRRKIFFKNYYFIMKSNTKNRTYTLKMNNFGHLDKMERSELLMHNRSKKLYGNKSPLFVGTPIPFKYDWRDFGVVSPVKNQMGRSTCYAFSANHSLQFTLDNGISTSVVYPYCTENLHCNRNNPYGLYKLEGFTNLTPGDEDNLLRALYHIGPISISMDANSDDYIFYGSGIIDFSFCSSFNLNHSILAVGYSLYGKPYLIVKNSWGINWGMNGYFHIALFRNNMCGIATDSTMP